MIVFLRRKFDAAHVLDNQLLSDEENKECFGKCNHVHGHTWIVEVEGDGPVDSKTGMVMNFNEIKDVIDAFDHGFINDILPLPTAENLVEYLIGKLSEMNVFTKIRVRVYESENAYAEDTYEDAATK